MAEQTLTPAQELLALRAAQERYKTNVKRLFELLKVVEQIDPKAPTSENVEKWKQLRDAMPALEEDIEFGINDPSSDDTIKGMFLMLRGILNGTLKPILDKIIKRGLH